MKMKYVLPLVIFLELAIFLMVGLNRDPREVPSPLIGKPASEFSLPRLDDPNKVVSKKDMLGQVWLLNVWSSWCGSCRQEHPILVEIAKNKAITLVGLNYKEVRGDGSFDMDKISAESGRWRTPETTLHLFALIGGWPGALLAQRKYRHKTRKVSFRRVFWMTVALNCAALGVIARAGLHTVFGGA